MTARPLSIALALTLCAPALAQVRDAPPFAGQVMEPFSSVAAGSHKQVNTAVGRFSSQSAFGIHLLDSFQNGSCGVVPAPSGGRVLSSDSHVCYHPNNYALSFPDPVARFGASWLGAHDSAAHFTLRFIDAQDQVIGERDVLLPADCQWHWVGFEFPVTQPAKRVTILNHDGARMVLDYATIDMGEVEATRYCPPSSANSTGEPAWLSALGSGVVASDDLWLRAAPVPDTVGIFYYGDARISVPFGNGTRCVGGSSGISRLAPTQAVGGAFVAQVDLSPASGITAGSTWHFQTLYRDAVAGQPLVDLSDALTLAFQ